MLTVHVYLKELHAQLDVEGRKAVQSEEVKVQKDTKIAFSK